MTVDYDRMIKEKQGGVVVNVTFSGVHWTDRDEISAKKNHILPKGIALFPKAHRIVLHFEQKKDADTVAGTITNVINDVSHCRHEGSSTENPCANCVVEEAAMADWNVAIQLREGNIDRFNELMANPIWERLIPLEGIEEMQSVPLPFPKRSPQPVLNGLNVHGPGASALSNGSHS